MAIIGGTADRVTRTFPPSLCFPRDKAQGNSSLMLITGNPLEVVLTINFKEVNGVQEIYHLSHEDWDQGETEAAELAIARSYVLAKNSRIEFVQLRQAAYPGESMGLLQDPLPALSCWGFLHTPHSALKFRLQDGAGKYAFRFFHMIADSEMADETWIRQPYVLPDIAPVLPLDPATAPLQDLWDFFLCTVRDKSHYAKRLPDLPSGAYQFEIRKWRDVFFMAARAERINKAYRRVSWEAFPRENAPAFSPCGTVTAVVRQPYEAKCQFYPNGPVENIRHYWAKPDARLLPFRTIFWPWREARQIENTTRLGERTTGPGYWRSPGTSLGDAPGTAPTGTPTDFLGLTVRPWEPPEPTPIEFLPGCDMPIAADITAELSDLSVVDRNARIFEFDDATFDMEEVAPGHVKIIAKSNAITPCDEDCSHWSTDVPVLSPSTPFSLRRSTTDATLLAGTYVQVDGQLITSAQYSFAAWVKEKPIVGHGPMTGIYDAIGNNLVLPGSFSPGSLGVEINRCEGSEVALYSSLTDFPAPADDFWHHYGIAVDLTTSPCPYAEMYLDGVLVFAGQVPFFNRVAGVAPIAPYALLAFNSGHTFNANFKVFDSFLSSAVFATLASGAAGPPAQHNYKMDEGKGLIVHDTGTSPIDGRIAGCVTPGDCAPTGAMLYGGLVVEGKVINPGSPITIIGGGTF